LIDWFFGESPQAVAYSAQPGIYNYRLRIQDIYLIM